MFVELTKSPVITPFIITTVFNRGKDNPFLFKKQRIYLDFSKAKNIP
jgi:hypothetical protein